MAFDFTGKVALVTGGSRGIGRSIVEGFAKAGAETILTYASSSQKADELTESLKQQNCKVSAHKVDVKDSEAMSEFIETTLKEHGKVDILVNNAGIIRDTLIMMMKKEDWQDVIDTNLTGAYNAIRPLSRAMMKNRGGSIINLSSIAASKPGRGHSNYAATKGAIESFTKAVASELGAKGIRVNAVAPGMIETDMSQAVRDAAGEEIKKSIPLRKFGKPEDIANAVMFLASDYAAYINGEVLHVDGGL